MLTDTVVPTSAFCGKSLLLVASELVLPDTRIAAPSPLAANVIYCVICFQLNVLGVLGNIDKRILLGLEFSVSFHEVAAGRLSPIESTLVYPQMGDWRRAR